MAKHSAAPRRIVVFDPLYYQVVPKIATSTMLNELRSGVKEVRWAKILEMAPPLQEAHAAEIKPLTREELRELVAESHLAATGEVSDRSLDAFLVALEARCSSVPTRSTSAAAGAA